MASKRNKLLIFLGLITVAVSKSHNQRFDIEPKFESIRTSSASKPSANSRQIDAVRESNPLLRSTHSENEKSTQFFKRFGSVLEESNDRSTTIDPKDFYFEPQKVKGRRTSSGSPAVSDERFFSHRTGILIADTLRPDVGPKIEMVTFTPQQQNKHNGTTSAKGGEATPTKGSETSDEKKDVVKKKKKPRRKKVVRVRARVQNGNKTRPNDDKPAFKVSEKVKLIDLSSSGDQREKPRHPVAVKIPPAKTSSEGSGVKKETGFKFSEFSSQKEVPNKKGEAAKKKSVEEKGETVKYDDPDKNDQFVAFYRRTGQKNLLNNVAGLQQQQQRQYPDQDWISMYKSENHNKDDNFYVLSFNYMGNNKRDPIKSTFPRENVQDDLQVKHSPPKESGERPSEELNIRHLEKAAQNFFQRQKDLVKVDAGHQQSGYYRPEEDVSVSGGGNSDLYHKKSDVSEDLASDKGYSEKQHSPTVTLKRKKTKSHKEPVWKLQKKIPSDQWKKDKTTPARDGHDNFRNNDDGGQQKTTTDYYVRSFIKLPTGEKLDMNLKERLPHGGFKEATAAKRKPLLPPENKQDGNYFVHVYKKMGNAEDFDIQSGNGPENRGYLSSIKLSWTDDDTRASVVEALDSRSFVPKEHTYSAESVISAETIHRDVMVAQPSENIMRYKSDYDVDDFMSPLAGEKSFYFRDVPFVRRRKRSAPKTARVATHFILGDSKVENNYTLEHKPTARFFSKRIGAPVNNKTTPEARQPSTQSRGAAKGEPSVPTGMAAKGSYYLKPVESRGIKDLKTEFNIPEVFDKYVKPSRNVTNIEIFHAYHTPNRDPKQAHDMTYFHNDKNRQVKIQITDSRTHASQPTSSRTIERGVSPLKNFKVTTGTGVVQSSTEIRESYLEPGKETATKVLKPDGMGETSSRASQKQPRKETRKVPVIQARNDEEIPIRRKVPARTTAKPATAKPAKRPNTIPSRTTVKPTTTSTKTTVKPSTTSSRTTVKPATTSLRTTVKPDTTSSKTTVQADTTSSKTTVNPATTSSKTTVKPATTSSKTTVKPATTSLKTTVKPATTSSKTTVKPTTTSARTTVKPRTTRVRTSATSPFRTTTKLVSARTTIKPATTSVSVRTTLRLPARSTRTTTRPATTTVKTAIKPSASTTEERFSRKESQRGTIGKGGKLGDVNGLTRHEARAASTVQARRIDDKTWLYPEDYSGGESPGGVQEDFVNRLEEDRGRQKGGHREFEPPQDEGFREVSVGASPQVPAAFQWRDPLPKSQEPEHPTYHFIPKTSFRCKGRPPGYYADPETGCQVFHMCQGTGVKHSFLCPNTTIFNQRLLVCDFYTKAMCETSESFYEVNNQLYKVPPKKAKEYESRSKKTWKSQKSNNNLNVLTVKHARPAGDNYGQNDNRQATQGRKTADGEIADVPLFVVKHFKENIPNAEFGKPRGVSKSYSAVISEPITSTPVSGKTGGRNGNEKPLFHVEETPREKLIPDNFADKYRTIKDRWIAKTSQKTPREEEELFRVPDETPVYRENPVRYLKPLKSTVKHTPDKTIIITPLVENDNSYYVPNSEGKRGDVRNDNVHVAGRQNEKVIVVNRNRFSPAPYDSSESHESKESPETAGLRGNQEHAYSVQRYKNDKYDSVNGRTSDQFTPLTTQKPQNEGFYQKSKGSNDAPSPKYKYNVRDHKQDHFEARTPQYVHPLTDKTQTGTRDFNYGYRTEDPTLQKGQTSSQPRSNQDVRLETGDRGDPQKAQIKTRIAEIKSGIESIGAQVGGILGGRRENTFKNVRIFKLKPDGSDGELEEIRLSPFKFERQSGNSKLKEKKREKLAIEVVRNDPRAYDNSDARPKPDRQKKLKNNEKKPQINAGSDYGRNIDQKAYLTIPKVVQKVVEDIASPKYKNFPAFKPNKASYGKNTDHKSQDQFMKALQNNMRTKVPKARREPNTEFLIENVSTRTRNNVPREKPVIHDIESRLPPSKTTSKETPDKSYEVKYIPLINVDEFTKPEVRDQQELRTPPVRNNGKSEHFETIFVPKNTQGRGSDFVQQGLAKFQEQKNAFFNTKPNLYVNTPRFANVDATHNEKYNFDNPHKKQPVINDNLNQKFPTPTYTGSQNNNQNLFPKTTTSPNGQKKEVRTFVVLSKPATTTERYSGMQPNAVSNTPHYSNFKTTEIPSSTRPNTATNAYQYNNFQPMNIQPAFNQNLHQRSVAGYEHPTTFPKLSNAVSLELGKNGPQKQALNANRGVADFSVYYNPRDESSASSGSTKCQDNADSGGQNQEPESKAALITNQSFFNKPPAPKLAFKELKRPEYAYAPAAKTSARFNTKAADETVQLKSKPVKLFELPRNSRPAFTKPATAIPITIPESRNNYYPPQMVREMRPVRNLQNERRQVRPVTNFQNQGKYISPVGPIQNYRRPARPPMKSHFQEGNRQMRPVGHVPSGNRQMRPAGHVPDGNRQMRPVSQVPNGNRQMRPVGHIPDDSRSMDRPKRVVHGKNSRFIDLEKAAELKAMQKSRETEQKTQVNKFPVVRPKPQGEIMLTKSKEDSSSSSSSSEKSDHSRHSRYADLEKAAELKAEQIVKSKSKSTS